MVDGVIGIDVVGISNFGAFGVDGGTPIINHPQGAILGVGAGPAEVLGGRDHLPDADDLRRRFVGLEP